MAGASVALLLASGCNDDDSGTGPNNNTGEITLASGDIGILQFAFALEQLEAAFYERVLSAPPSDLIGDDMALITMIHDNEITHREWFRTLLGSNALTVTPKLDASLFANRQKVLETAMMFEDLGVSAYNGAGQFLSAPLNLTLSGKIVSVEARQAAALRDRLQPNTAYFAGDDMVDPATGLDKARTPSEVLTIARPYIQTTININNLPTT